MKKGSLESFLLFFLAQAVWILGEEFSLEKCKSLGFNKAVLSCSSCSDLVQFSLKHLTENCNKCCQDDGGAALTDTKYPKAILEVCGWRLGAYPQVQAFIKSDRTERYPGLTVKYVRGADPMIKLLDEDDDVVETLAIDKWNTDSVEEFLDIYLETASSSSSSAASSNEEPQQP